MTDAGPELTVLFDFRDPWSYLALEPIRAMLERTGAVAAWWPFLVSPLREPVDPGRGAERGALHRWHRARYLARDLERYARAAGLPARHFHQGQHGHRSGLYRQAGGEVAAMGFNRALREGAAVAGEYRRRVFLGYWDGDLELDSVAEIQRVLEQAGADPSGFPAYAEGEGPAALAAQRDAAVAWGVFATPALELDGEVFVGRQHLDYLAWRLGRRAEMEETTA